MAKPSPRRAAANRAFTVIVTHRPSPDAEARLTRLARVCLAAVATEDAAPHRVAEKAGNAENAGAALHARSKQEVERAGAGQAADHERAHQHAGSTPFLEPTRLAGAARSAAVSEPSEAAPSQDRGQPVKRT